MKVLVLLALLLGRLASAQTPPALLAVYADAKATYQLSYPRTWQVRKGPGPSEATFLAGATQQPTPAEVTLTARPLPEAQKNQRLTTHGGQDSVWRSIQRLPKSQVLGLEQRDFGSYDEVGYEYTYAPNPSTGARTRVVGRRVWRGGYDFRVEYRADASHDARYLAEGKSLVGSFAFTAAPFPSRRYADQLCDDKLYGIAAQRYHNGQWEDDCRTIHEFPSSNLTVAPVVHAQALPFQSYALAKGFDNCLYSVTKAPTDAPEFVYRYDPATRTGRYTSWQLPAQGPDNNWISAATDDRGNLYFHSSDGNQLVKIDPASGSVAVLWFSDPVKKAAFYPTIAFPGAGTHGNFCLDDAHTMYLVYSTDGALMKVDLVTQRPNPELMALSGLPERGGYSDLLMQNDEAGRRRLYLAGPKAVYKVDLARRQASFVRKGTYTDLAGCNLFRIVPHPAPAPPPPATATRRGRVLDALTYRPLPHAQLRLGAVKADQAVPLRKPTGSFSFAAKPGQRYAYRAQLPGYLTADSTWTAAPGPNVQDILLQPLAVGTTLQLDHVQFEQGQAVLLPTSFSALDQLAGLLSSNPRLTIELRGHTDNVGPPEKNVVLSAQRVTAVKAYLVGRGIAEARITGIGFGGAQPLASNEEEATRKLNRRVEFRITGTP